jgi:hypothetical protein
MNNPSDQPVGVVDVKPLDGFKVRVTFRDNTLREINLEPFLRGPIFEPIRQDVDMFRRVMVDPEWECLVWPNGADIDSDSLYYGGPPPWAEADVHGNPLPDRLTRK